MVVRMFPADYRMDVISPLQTAMAGYQAGFGQFQQLDDVRRQREADRMAAELHDAKMAEYERATAAAQAAQLEQAAFYEGFADGTHTPESLRRFRMSQNEIIREIAGEQLASLDEDARRSQFDRRAQLAVAFQRDPDAAISMLEQEREAALNAGDQDTVNIIDGFLPIVRNDPAAGDAVAYQLAMRVGTDDEMDNLDKLLAFGEPEEYESAMDARGVRRYTEGPKTGQIVPGFEAERPIDQQMGIRAITRADGTTEFSYGPMDQADALEDVPFDVDPDQPRGKQGTVVRIPGTAEIRISPEPQQAQATKAFNAYGSIVRKHDMMRSQATEIRRLIEMGEGGWNQFQESIPLIGRVTYAQKLRNHIMSLQNQVAFMNLAEMRQNSPTGGAVGSLTDPEREALGALLGPLDPYFPDQVLATLDSMDFILADDERRYLDALETDYGTIATVVRTRRQAATETSAAQSRTYNQATGTFD